MTESVIKLRPTKAGQVLNIARVSAEQPEHNTRDNTGYAVVTVKEAAPQQPKPEPEPRNGGGAFGWLSFIWLVCAFILSKRR